MHRTTNTRLSEVNPHLICVQCGGYFIDATTIIECLHSFCKTCILKHLETSKHCPVCDVMVHRTRPLQNIRPDKTLQDLVYKLVPGLFASEMKRRRDFYASAAERGISTAGLSLEERGEAVQEQAMVRENENISVCLELSLDGKTGVSVDSDDSKTPADRRYLLCPSAVTIGHLKKLVRMKYSLDNYQIDMFHTDQRLRDSFTLLDIAYIYAWRRKEPLKLYYTVFDKPCKKVRFATEVCSNKVEEQSKNDSMPMLQKNVESKSSVSDQRKILQPVETTTDTDISRLESLSQTDDKETENTNDKHLLAARRHSAEDTNGLQHRNGTVTLSKSSSDSDDGTISKELQRCGLSVQSFKNETPGDKECTQSSTSVVNCVKHDLVSTDMCNNRAVESVEDQLSDSSPGHSTCTSVKSSAGENGIGSRPLHIEIEQNGSVRSDSETMDSPGSSVLDYSMPCESLDLSLSKSTDINRNLSLNIKNSLNNKPSKQEVRIENGRAFVKNALLPATSCGNTSPQRGITCLSRDGKYEPDRNGSQNRVPKSPLIPPLYPMNATSPESSCVTFQGEKRCFQQVAKSSKKCFSDKRQKMSHLDSVVRKIQNIKPMDQSPNETNNNGGEGFQDFSDEPLDLSNGTMVV